MVHKTKIGKKILDQLMFSLYSEAETIYREYIQNASDAIKDAVMQGVMDKKDGHVTVSIDKYNKRIVISDNGIGIRTEEAESRLKDISKSSKSDVFAGHYGIGRFVGAGYCSKLSFKTSAYGEDQYAEVIYDVDEIRKILADKDNDTEATEVIDQVTTVLHGKEDTESHYFIVTLDGILSDYVELLDEDKIYTYLRQVAPISYSTQFKMNLINAGLKECEEKYSVYYENLDNVSITLNDHVDIRKPYDLTISGTGDEISSLRFFTLTDHEYGDLAWGWYAVTPFTKQIPDMDNTTNTPVITRGIRLRSHNIQIGGESFFDGTKYFKQARSNKYFNGEIHIINSNINPNAARDGLANTNESIRLLSLIKSFFKELEKEYQTANSIKNALKEAKVSEIKYHEISDKEDNSVNFPKESKADLLEAALKEKQSKTESFNKIVAKKDSDTLGLKAVKNLYQKDAGDFYKGISDGTINIEVEKKALENETTSTPKKVKEVSTEDDIKKLSKIYSTDAMDMLKRILSILDGYKDPKLKGVRNTIIKKLKE